MLKQFTARCIKRMLVLYEETPTVTVEGVSGLGFILWSLVLFTKNADASYMKTFSVWTFWPTIWPIVFLLTGLLQVLGIIAGSRNLRGVGAMFAFFFLTTMALTIMHRGIGFPFVIFGSLLAVAQLIAYWRLKVKNASL